MKFLKLRSKLTNERTEPLHQDSLALNRILSDKSEFNVTETYKTIRTNIMFSLPKTDAGKVIAITSSMAGEGKTTTTVNLAITFAQTGAKVMLMDCDLRKARIHRYLQITRGTGVSNVLCGFESLERATRHSVRENLDVLTAGEIPPNPAELLESDEFARLIDDVKKKYDYVFIDTPPVTIVTDGMIVAKQSMGIVVVVRENSTSFDMLDETMDYLGKTGTSITGVIMLGSKEDAQKYGYRYGSRYKYGYKYGYKSGYGYKYGYKYGDYKYGDEPEQEDAEARDKKRK